MKSDQQGLKIGKSMQIASPRVDNELVSLPSVNLTIYFADLLNRLKGLKAA